MMVLAAAVLIGCGTAPAGKSTSPATARGDLPIPPDLRARVETSAAIGAQLYVLDKVSALATDELASRVPDFRDQNLGGYLPMREGTEDGRPLDSYLVYFFTREEPPRVAYQIRVRPNAKPELEAFAPPQPATDSFVAFVRARQGAIAAVPPGHQPINPVLIPGSANGEKGILVYLLAGTTTPNVAVFGKHYRVLMPEAGGVPRYVMPLSKSALELPVRPPSGGKPKALMVTHLLTDWPLETHVFVSLLWHLPVYVATARGIWRVDGDKIALVDDRPPKTAP